MNPAYLLFLHGSRKYQIQFKPPPSYFNFLFFSRGLRTLVRAALTPPPFIQFFSWFKKVAKADAETKSGMRGGVGVGGGEMEGNEELFFSLPRKWKKMEKKVLNGRGRGP